MYVTEIPAARLVYSAGPLFPTAASRGGRGSSFELSVHQISREMVLQVADVFPDAPIPPAQDDAVPFESVVGQVLMVPTFQVRRRCTLLLSNFEGSLIDI
jgi:hypothetical protein